MPLQDTEYETYYGVQLLDDLHNYFPDILYNHTHFRSITDVFGYMQDIMNSRFNLFSSATSRFRQQQPQRQQQQPRRQQQQHQQQYIYTIPTTFTDFVDTPSNHIQFAPIRFSTTERRPQTPPSPPSPLSETDIENNTIDSQPRTARHQPRTVSAVSVLSQILEPTLGVNDILSSLLGSSLSDFTDPVIVAPSRYQIASATRRYIVQTDLESPCAICQDTIRADTEVRKIDVCQHTFHKDCIDRWFSINVSCPVCRHDIRNPIRQTAQTSVAGAQVD
jgi:hypothetical protein